MMKTLKMNMIPKNDNEICLFQSEHNETDLQRLVGETIGCAVIDSGCPKNVGGIAWYKSYLDTINPQDKEKVSIEKSNRKFTFGKGLATRSLYQAKIPATIGSNHIFIKTDIVNADIPLLLSKEALKKSKTILDFTHGAGAPR